MFENTKKIARLERRIKNLEDDLRALNDKVYTSPRYPNLLFQPSRTSLQTVCQLILRHLGKEVSFTHEGIDGCILVEAKDD